MHFILPLIAVVAGLEGILPQINVPEHDAKWERLLFKKDFHPESKDPKGIHEALERIREWKEANAMDHEMHEHMQLAERAKMMKEKMMEAARLMKQQQEEEEKEREQNAKHMHEMLMKQAMAEQEHLQKLKEEHEAAQPKLHFQVTIPEEMKQRLSPLEQERIKQMAMAVMRQKLKEDPASATQPRVIVFRLRRRPQPAAEAAPAIPAAATPAPKVFIKVIKIHDRLVVDEHEELKEHTADVENEVFAVNGHGQLKPLFKNRLHLGMKKKEKPELENLKMRSGMMKAATEDKPIEEPVTPVTPEHPTDEQDEQTWKEWIDELMERARKGDRKSIATVVFFALLLVIGVAALFTSVLLALSPTQAGYHQLDDEALNYPANSAPLRANNNNNNNSERTPLV